MEGREGFGSQQNGKNVKNWESVKREKKVWRRRKKEEDEEERGGGGRRRRWHWWNVVEVHKANKQKIEEGGGELWKLRKSGWKGHKIRALPFIGFMRIEEQKSQVLVENKKKSGLHLGVHLGPEKKQFFVIQKGFLRPKNIRILDLR